MDLFSITCTTCKSRLKVREESAIGQILGCPKCGGMVMVKPPEGWKKGEPTPAPHPEAAPAITTIVEVRNPDETLGDSNFDVVDDLLSDAPPKIRQPSVAVAPDAPALARPRFVGGPPPTSSPSPFAGEGPGVRGSAAPDHPSQPQQPDPTPPPPGEANADALPPPDWSPPRPWRYWAMMAGSVVAGVVLALAVVVGMIHIFRDDPSAVAQAGTNSQPPTVSPTSAQGNPAGPATAPAITPVAPVASKIPNPATAVPAAPIESPPVTPEAPAVEAAPAEQDPEGIVEPPPAAAPANPKDPLAKFDQLLEGDANPLPMPAEAAPALAPSSTEPGSAPSADPVPPVPEKPALPRPAPRVVDVAGRLADPLTGIETSGTPLADFLQFVSDLTTISITLEPDGLPFVRATAESHVVLTGKNTTVGEALAAGLKPLGLEHVAADDQVVVRLIEPATLPAINYPVKDLAADEQQMADLAAMLQAVVEPASWAENGGEGTLKVDPTRQVLAISQRRSVHAQLLIACEKLRTARKLPYATGTRYDPRLFNLDTRLARAQARLETPISLNFSQPTPLVRILERLGQAGGVRMLVDWRDVAAAEWNPDGEATLVADKVPLAAALDSLLAPMDLTWRVVDGQTIQVLTPQTLAARAELEFYQVDGRLGDDPTGDTLLIKLCSTLGEAHFRENGGAGELRYDEVGQCLLASLPQPKQRELEALLAKWRSELPAK